MRFAGNAFHLHYTAELISPIDCNITTPRRDQGRVRAHFGVMQAAGQTSPIPPEWMDNAGQHLNLSLDRTWIISSHCSGPIELERSHTLKITPESGVNPA